MAASSPNQDIFKVDNIRSLVELMEEHDLSEIDLRQGETRVQLRRGTRQAAAEVVMSRPPSVAPPVATPSPQADEGKHFTVVKSPIVGTLYLAPNPESPACVKVGDHVGPETTVCIVEAMKVFNQIPAGISGKIVSVLAESGEPVEFGQPLFKVDTRE